MNNSAVKNKTETGLSLFFELSCYLMIVGLFFSRAVLSVSSALILILGLSYLILNKSDSKPFLEYVIFPIVWLFLLASGLYTSNYDEWLKILFRDLILVCIPVGFYFSKPLCPYKIKKLFLFFCFLSFLCIIINTLYALSNYSEFVTSITHSKNIPSLIGPIHNELGLLSVIGFILLCFFYNQESKLRIKRIYLIALVLIFIAYHILAYRFSILIIYITGFSYLFLLIIQNKLYKKAVIGLTITVSILILIYSFITPFKNRVNNTMEDVEVILYNKNPNYHSIAQRWYANKCALEIIAGNPLIGVAPADLPNEMMKQYEKNSYLLIPENRIFIHNQLLFYAASLGLPFTIAWFFSLIILLYKKSKQNSLFYWIMIPFILSMMIENTFEMQIAANGFLFFFYLLFNFEVQAQKIT